MGAAKLSYLFHESLEIFCYYLRYVLLLQSCEFLVDALSVLTVVASGCQDKTLRKNFCETILRLANHYWEELALVSKYHVGTFSYLYRWWWDVSSHIPKHHQTTE